MSDKSVKLDMSSMSQNVTMEYLKRHKQKVERDYRHYFGNSPLDFGGSADELHQKAKSIVAETGSTEYSKPLPKSFRGLDTPKARAGGIKAMGEWAAKYEKASQEKRKKTAN